MAFNNSASPEIIWGLGGPEEDHQLHHCCWTGRVSEREEEEVGGIFKYQDQKSQELYLNHISYHGTQKHACMAYTRVYVPKTKNVVN